MKFSIRDLLWVITLAAVALAWWIDRSRREPPSPLPPAGTYYELVVYGKDHDRFLLFDRQTGACWERYSNGVWSPHTTSLRSNSD